ncbi:hypothetical protein DPMN_134942 [Dreissena polymorpha]|uniref:Uncharacterized protein n=1 Tax=Dreissena polymorpha TaxID=45954 RepID=A0A9D4FWK9_DREPO|nr:hypothetical protein DPMN_134942 [Dreissena polymorpha]
MARSAMFTGQQINTEMLYLTLAVYIHRCVPTVPKPTKRVTSVVVQTCVTQQDVACQDIQRNEVQFATPVLLKSLTEHVTKSTSAE